MIARLFRPLLLIVAIACLGACARAPSPGAGAASEAPTKYPTEGSLGLLLPAVYLGKTTQRPRAEWFDRFERDTGCRLSIATADSDEELAARLQRGGIDVVVADGIGSVRLIQGGEVQPLDEGRMASLSSVDPRFAKLPWLSQHGVRFGLPLQAGARMLLYDPRVFPAPVTTWSVLYDAQELPDGRGNAGRVLAQDGAVSIADAAVYLSMRRPEPGLGDPFELDERQFAAALALLRAQRPLQQAFGPDDNARRAGFREGRIAAMSSSVRQFDHLRDEGVEVAMSLPAEGGTGWLHAALLARDAKHPNCAYAFMAWSLKPRIQAEMSAIASSLPVVASVCRNGKLLDRARCAELGQDALARISFAHLPTASCSRRAACVPYSRWLADFQSLGDVAP